MESNSTVAWTILESNTLVTYSNCLLEHRELMRIQNYSIGYLGMIIKASSHLTVIVSILHTSGRVVVLGARRSLMSSIVDGNVSCMGQLLTT